MLVLISYDLKHPGRDYTSLYETIKQVGNAWCHYLESVWIVETQIDINSCYSMIRPTINDNDLLFIVEITGMKNQGWLPSKAWDWINSRNH